MFTCIACTKADGGEEVGARGSTTPNTKEAVKSLTTQVSLSLYMNLISSFFVDPSAFFFALFCCFSLIALLVKQTKDTDPNLNVSHRR